MSDECLVHETARQYFILAAEAEGEDAEGGVRARSDHLMQVVVKEGEVESEEPNGATDAITGRLVGLSGWGGTAGRLRHNKRRGGGGAAARPGADGPLHRRGRRGAAGASTGVP